MANILAKKKSTVENVVIVNQNIEKYKHLDDLTLCDFEDLVDFGISEFDNKGSIIPSLFIKTSKETLLINLARSVNDITPDELFADDVVTTYKLRVRNMESKTEPGVYDGPLYMSFGKPDNITLNKVASFVESTEKVGG